MCVLLPGGRAVRVECSACGVHLGDKPDEGVPEGAISHGLCDDCAHRFIAQMGMPLERYIEGLAAPIAAVGPTGVIGAVNERAGELLGTTSAHVRGFQGGDVFECEYSFEPEGCGQTVHCSGCTIRNTVMDTRRTGRAHRRVPATLSRSTDAGRREYELLISTSMVGGVVFLQIEEMSEAGSE